MSPEQLIAQFKTRKCVRHENTMPCPVCFSAAENQRDKQRREEAKALHAIWLAEQER